MVIGNHTYQVQILGFDSTTWIELPVNNHLLGTIELENLPEAYNELFTASCSRFPFEKLILFESVLYF